MKAGLTVSTFAHALVLVVLLLSFAAPVLPESRQTEEIPISLVPLGDEMALKQGEKQASQKLKPAQKRTQKPQTKAKAENAGDADIDTKMPLKPKEKPREINAPPPAKGEEESKAAPAEAGEAAKPPQQPAEEKPAESAPPPEKPAPQPEKAAEVKPEKPAEAKPAEEKPAPAAPKDDIGDFLKTEKAELSPLPVPEPPKPKPLEKPKPSAPELPQKAPLPISRPESAPKKPEKAAAPQEKAAPPKGEKNGAEADSSRNALIDRTRTQGGGAKRSESEAGLGAQKTIGDNDNLQQTLDNLIGSCVARNWDIGVLQGGNAYDLRVQMHFKLKQDGSLDGDPKLTPGGGDAKDRDVIAVQALAALKKCAPFKLPADKYAKWRDVTMNMKAFTD